MNEDKDPKRPGRSSHQKASMSSAGKNLPFAGRDDEISQLLAAFAQRRNLVISGPAGVGKSALLSHVSTLVPLFVCSKPTNLEEVCEQYLEFLGLRPESFGTQERRSLTHLRIQQDRYPIAFDIIEQKSATSLSPHITGFFAHVPIWIVTRIEPSQGTSLFGEIHEFAHLQLSPLKKNEVRTLIAHAAAQRLLPSFAVHYAECFYRRSKGSPRLLQNFLHLVSLRKPNTEDALRHCFELYKDSLEDQQDCLDPT